MSRSSSILIVDDEATIRKLVQSYLEAEGWSVFSAVDGAEAIDLVRSQTPDLVVLDISMPNVDGLEALRQIRSFSSVYIIMLTARAEESDKLVGLGVGADDYLTKPFSPRELVARIKAVFRRASGLQPGDGAAPSAIIQGSMEVDGDKRLVRVEGQAKELTALEFDLLVTLIQQPGRVFSRRQLLELVWGWDHFGDERVVDVHIRNLRRALGDNASKPRWIGTVRGVGYRFMSTESWPEDRES